MNQELRQEFMARLTPGAREEFMKALIREAGESPAFPVCESPLFFTESFRQEAVDGAQRLLRQIQTPEFRAYCQGAIPNGQAVPGMDDHPHFIQVDFAITDQGPRLIELQGFPSVYAYQIALDRAYRSAGLIGEDLTSYLEGATEQSTLESLKQIILGGCSPEEVVLMEIHPESQRTRVDFAATERLIGIKTVCMSQIRRSGRDLTYLNDGIQQPIKRIYNRVIFDDLERNQIDSEFHPTDEVNVSWAGHPNWFHMLSKHTLPFLKDAVVPECFRVSDLTSIPDDLENWVLKPLYSFAGAGVNLQPNREAILAVDQPDHWLLQRKITYSNCMQTPAGPRKAELRLMVLWDDVPKIVNSLVRVSSTGMSGVGANLSEPWVGATLAYGPVQ